jgi:hypothetical protein
MDNPLKKRIISVKCLSMPMDHVHMQQMVDREEDIIRYIQHRMHWE